jgi:hypothetical protein
VAPSKRAIKRARDWRLAIGASRRAAHPQLDDDEDVPRRPRRRSRGGARCRRGCATPASGLASCFAPNVSLGGLLRAQVAPATVGDAKGSPAGRTRQAALWPERNDLDMAKRGGRSGECFQLAESVATKGSHKNNPFLVRSFGRRRSPFTRPPTAAAAAPFGRPN